MKIIIEIDYYLLSLFNILEWFIYIVYPDLYFCIYILLLHVYSTLLHNVLQFPFLFAFMYIYICLWISLCIVIPKIFKDFNVFVVQKCNRLSMALIFFNFMLDYSDILSTIILIKKRKSCIYYYHEKRNIFLLEKYNNKYPNPRPNKHFILCNTDINIIFEIWLLCEWLYFKRNVFPTEVKTLRHIILSFWFLRLWNSLFSLYIQIYIFILSTLFLLLHSNFSCFTILFSLLIYIYNIFNMMCTMYDIMLEWFNKIWVKSRKNNVYLYFIPALNYSFNKFAPNCNTYQLQNYNTY